MNWAKAVPSGHDSRLRLKRMPCAASFGISGRAEAGSISVWKYCRRSMKSPRRRNRWKACGRHCRAIGVMSEANLRWALLTPPVVAAAVFHSTSRSRRILLPHCQDSNPRHRQVAAAQFPRIAACAGCRPSLLAASRQRMEVCPALLHHARRSRLKPLEK